MPPANRPPWTRDGAAPRGDWDVAAGRRFMLRAALLLGVLFVIAVALGTMGFWFLAIQSGWITGAPWAWQPPMMTGGRFPFPFAGLLWLGLIIFVITRIVRAFRRMVQPMRVLIDGTARVQAGDLSTRVPVPTRGPRDARRLLEAFNAMTARLQANETARRNLLADVTHELRTPLTVIQGNTEGLLDGLYPRDDAHLSVILDETRVLARLVDDLRTLSLAESGALALQREPAQPADLINDVCAAFASQAQAAGITLQCTAAPDLPELALDEVRMREVLGNLISNAMRHTPAGGAITLEAARTPSHVTLQVRDTGSGIAPDMLPHVFDRFAKGRDSGGSGLGLAIARQLVLAHGGEISVTSTLGQGTRVTVLLPP